MKKVHQGFTLVELIIAIIILGILSTIGFLSYGDYIAGSRDANRISQIKDIYTGLQLYATNKKLPYPDNYVTITASGTLVSYQGYAGEGILASINYKNGGKDPKDKSYFTYVASKNRKELQVMGFLEEKDNLETQVTQLPISKASAASYVGRYMKSLGEELGVYMQDARKLPLQDLGISTFELLTSTENYSVYFSDIDTFTASGYTLLGLSQSRFGKDAPTDCPEGFIGVPGNPEFSTQGFCVAQYEMTYTDANTPNSTSGGSDWNSVIYDSNKITVSQAGKYPIASITQQQAINACRSMGNGYHLITNNEWMTIARSIETNPKNWSSGTVGQGNLWNGVSGNTTFGCNATGGNIETTPGRIYATKTGPGESSCNPRRSHILTNGQIIWDFSGNLREHVNKDNTEEGLLYSAGTTTIAGTSSGSNWDNDGIYFEQDMRKYGSANFLGTSKGLGNLYAGDGTANNIFTRGATATDNSSGGIYSLLLHQSATSQIRSLGFRCAK